VKSAIRSMALAIAAGLIVATCGQGSSPGPSGTALPVPSGSAGSSAAPTSAAGTVRLALDWTPNTNHTGFYVAANQGWYRDAGVDVAFLPYTGTTPEALMVAGQAECGISFHDALTFAVAAGADITSVMAILQHTAQEIAVLEASAIERPRDLDGKVYAGFGYPNEKPTIRAVIRDDGGQGEFQVATLDTAVYEALYAQRADFAIIFTAWEGVEAEQRDIDLRTFRFTDYGFPDFYQVVLACDRGWLDASPELARSFIAATVRGFELAASDPEAASAILVEENPQAFGANPDLPLASARFLADGDYLVDPDGAVGPQRLEQWRPYSEFLYEEGLLVDADSVALTEPPDYGALFTNDYLPRD